MTSELNWKPDAIVRDKATASELSFVLNLAKERVLVQTDDADKLYNRSLVFMGFCLTTLSSISAYVASNFKCSPLTFIMVAIGLLLLHVATILKENLLTIRYMGLGEKPQALLNEDFYKDLGNQKTEWHFLYQLNKAYSDRIELNEANNIRRGAVIKKAMTRLLFLPVAAIVGALIYLACSLLSACP